MNNSTALVQTVVVTLLLATAIAPAHGQTAAPDPLFKTIQSLDTQLFDAYNHCDLDKFGSFLADDLEFYHDKTGLSRGRPALVGGIKNNICGKVTRELVPGTLEVYPIANYGAVETGIHPSITRDMRTRFGRRGQVHPPLAKQGRSVEDHSGHQLRPPVLNQVTTT